MCPKITKRKEKRFFSKVFDRLSQVEKVIKSMQEDTVPDTHLTLLVKLDQSHSTNTQEAAERNEQLKAYWKRLLGSDTEFGFFHNREIGTVFIAGPLSALFLHDVDGKKLAELSEGPYGILRGLGIDEPKATNYVKKLGEGHYLLIVKGHPFDLNGLERVVNGLDRAV